jgi:hypothetical protein
MTYLAMNNEAEHYDICQLQSIAVYWELTESVVADNNYLISVTNHAEGGVYRPNTVQGVSKAANESPVSTMLHGSSNCAVYLPQILLSGE